MYIIILLDFGMSAVDSTDNILVGRPFGETAVLYRKTLGKVVKPIKTDCWRITALLLCSLVGPVLCCNVYMPTDYGTMESFVEYADVCSKLSVLFDDSDATTLLVTGDFNCNVNSRFYDMFTQFCHDKQLVSFDYTRLTDVFTYCSDDGLMQSWIDHVVCTSSLNNLIESVLVINDIICSDHRPFPVTFGDVISQPSDDKHMLTSNHIRSARYDWSVANSVVINLYQHQLDQHLESVCLPRCLVQRGNCCCTEAAHYTILSDYYNGVIASVQRASEIAIPLTVHWQNSKHNVPGWNEFVDEKHDLVREAFLDWVSAGRPHDNFLLPRMRRTRAAFKHALRYCRTHEEQIRVDAYAASLEAHDSKKFWE